LAPLLGLSVFKFLIPQKTMMNRTVNRPRRKPSARLTDGGNHALNFINTWRRDRKGSHFDLLNSYESLINWAEQTRLISHDKYLELEQERYCDQPTADHCYATIIQARLTIDELFNELLLDHPIHPLIIDRFNDAVTLTQTHLRYQNTPDGSVRQYWHNIHEDMNLPLYLIITAACQLLDSGQWRQIKKCPGCGSLFIDASRARNRTWCSPQTCGSVKKSQRYYRLRVA
jgi:predicted RNA-binding Zn ribbon-like protein